MAPMRSSRRKGLSPMTRGPDGISERLALPAAGVELDGPEATVIGNAASADGLSGALIDTALGAGAACRSDGNGGATIGTGGATIGTGGAGDCAGAGGLCSVGNSGRSPRDGTGAAPCEGGKGSLGRRTGAGLDLETV